MSLSTRETKNTQFSNFDNYSTWKNKIYLLIVVKNIDVTENRQMLNNN